MNDRLNPEHFRLAREALKATTPEQPLDILIVGGGVVGVGAALDAVSRGLSVGLVEMRDLASGTSSRSSRLAHGGLRYLEQREFGLVHEALTERGLLLDRLAPHLARPLPFIFPVTRRGWERPYVGMGIHLYDALSRVGSYGGTMPRPRLLSKSAIATIAPGLRQDAMTGAVRFHDAQIDDARHTIATARSAAGLGARILTGAKVLDVLQREGRVVGARVESDGEVFDVFARTVVSATGVWTDSIRSMVSGSAAAGDVRQSRGIHLVVPRSAFASSSAVITRTPHSVLFILPWGSTWLIGTTDTDADGDLAEPEVTAEDVDYLVAQANRWLTRPLIGSDIVGVYAGLRPLLAADQDEPTTSLSREHAVLNPMPGIVLIAGGKYTTYRVMAKDVVDAAVRQVQELQPEREFDECTTANIPLVGAEGFRTMWASRVKLAGEMGLAVETVEVLLRRHGDRITDVFDLIEADRSLADRLHPDTNVLRAEAVVAASTQGARSMADVLIRRLRIASQTRDRGLSAAPDIATLIAPVLGWDDDRMKQEMEIDIPQPHVPGRAG